MVNLKHKANVFSQGKQIKPEVSTTVIDLSRRMIICKVCGVTEGLVDKFLTNENIEIIYKFNDKHKFNKCKK